MKQTIQGAAHRMRVPANQELVRLGRFRLIDEYQIVLNPIVIGAGRTLFETVTDRIDLRLTRTKQFKNGNVVLWYEPD